jgi:hypothetical protein
MRRGEGDSYGASHEVKCLNLGPARTSPTTRADNIAGVFSGPKPAKVDWADAEGLGRLRAFQGLLAIMTEKRSVMGCRPWRAAALDTHPCIYALVKAHGT